MRESLLTIPVNEVFEPKTGCPICRMRDTVETHICEYIMGAAMMEPDVRIETNALGFCLTHYEMLLLQNNRLSLALMLNSHLPELAKKLEKDKPLSKKGLLPKKQSVKPEGEEDTCFVCAKVEWGILHMLKTVFTLFAKEPEFQSLFMAQEFICVPHYKLLSAEAAKQLNKTAYPPFQQALDKIMFSYLEQLNQDIDAFCFSFDYRNAGKLHKEGMEEARSSVIRSITFLTGRNPSNH